MGFLKNIRSPWLKRDYTKKVFFIKVKYLVKHLGNHDKDKILGRTSFDHQEKWQDTKEQKVTAFLEQGKDPLDFEPIRLVIHESKEEFRVEDGISRLRAFYRKKERLIRAEIRIGDW
ncbi:MAG: hypothetical protein V1866_01810 [archaeon]